MILALLAEQVNPALLHCNKRADANRLVGAPNRPRHTSQRAPRTFFHGVERLKKRQSAQDRKWQSPARSTTRSGTTTWWMSSRTAPASSTSTDILCTR